MKTYSDLQDIDSKLHLYLNLEPVGNPEVSVLVGKKVYGGGKLYKSIQIETTLDLTAPFLIQIELKNKIYNSAYETAVIIKNLQIDNLVIVPRFDYLATYHNDHNNTNPTHYLGFNGKWTLTFDRPFYQWLHQATGQGWLLS
jgi:hypothetical protein